MHFTGVPPYCHKKTNYKNQTPAAIFFILLRDGQNPFFIFQPEDTQVVLYFHGCFV